MLEFNTMTSTRIAIAILWLAILAVWIVFTAAYPLPSLTILDKRKMFHLLAALLFLPVSVGSVYFVFIFA
jgi:hypothetical protein